MTASESKPEVPSNVLRGYLEVSVPAVTDVLDLQYGLLRAMSHEIKPLQPKRIVGRAVTLLWTPGRAGPLDPFFAAVDACGEGSVLVAASGGDKTLGFMGDLVAAALHTRGAAGAVVDGAVRDVNQINEIGFPVFASGVSPVNPTGRASVTFDTSLVCGGVPVEPGDVVLADSDGVVVIPKALAVEVLEKSVALEKTETAIRERIKASVKTRKLGEIFADFE